MFGPLFNFPVENVVLVRTREIGQRPSSARKTCRSLVRHTRTCEEASSAHLPIDNIQGMEGEGSTIALAASPPVVPVVRKGLATKLPLGQRLLIRCETGWESCVVRGCVQQTDGAPAMLHRVEYDDGECHQHDLSTLDIMLKDNNAAAVVEAPPPTTSRHDDFAGAQPPWNLGDSVPASTGKRSGSTASRGEGKMPRVTPDGGAEALHEDLERGAHPRTGPEVRDTVIVRGLPPNLCLACRKGSPQPVALP